MRRVFTFETSDDPGLGGNDSWHKPFACAVSQMQVSFIIDFENLYVGLSQRQQKDKVTWKLWFYCLFYLFCLLNPLPEGFSEQIRVPFSEIPLK